MSYGVRWRRNKWQARVYIPRPGRHSRDVHLGMFPTARRAELACELYEHWLRIFPGTEPPANEGSGALVWRGEHIKSGAVVVFVTLDQAEAAGFSGYGISRACSVRSTHQNTSAGYRWARIPAIYA